MIIFKYLSFFHGKMRRVWNLNLKGYIYCLSCIHIVIWKGRNFNGSFLFPSLISRNLQHSRSSHLKVEPSQGPDIMTSVLAQLLVVLISLLLVLPVVEAVEAGDAIALFLAVVLCITGFCACLGVYARKRNGEVWLWRASWIKPCPEKLRLKTEL